jgi:hypothetical protein
MSGRFGSPQSARIREPRCSRDHQKRAPAAEIYVTGELMECSSHSNDSDDIRRVS